jgi:signal transduction histidine kinase
VKRTGKRDLKDFLRAITDPQLLDRVPLIAITFLTTLVHLISSVDLGFRDLHIRAPLALLSIAPVLALIWLAHRISGSSELIRFTLVPLSYFFGGALRGALLERLLQWSGVLEGEFESFRIFAGMTIVTGTCMVVAYSWSATQKARVTIAELQLETSTLAQALEKLRLSSDRSNRDELERVHERVSQELLQAIRADSADVGSKLETLIYQVVRPLSQDFAREIKNWKSPSTENLRLTFKTFWSSIDPVKHVRTPVVAVTSIIIASIASLFALFDFRNAVEVIVGATLSFLITSYLFFRILGKMYQYVKQPWREVLLTMTLFLIAIPTILIQRIALADTEDPNIYVIPTLAATPLVGWVIIIGTAALGLSKELTEKLAGIRDDLRWAIARINLLTWYQKGVISRMLHGPIQNSIQVAILRMKSADESKSTEIINEVIERIDRSLKDTLDPRKSTALEIQTLQSIAQTWKSVAEISIELSEAGQAALTRDLEASSIVTDLVEEVCSNSIRHGKARAINIKVDAIAGSIDISITDDGSIFIEEERSAGLGMQFLDACSIEWKRSLNQGLNSLYLRVPTSYGHGLGAATTLDEIAFQSQ